MIIIKIIFAYADDFPSTGTRLVPLRGRPELSSYSRAYTVYVGGRGGVKNHKVVYGALRFLFMVVKKQHFENTLLHLTTCNYISTCCG